MIAYLHELLKENRFVGGYLKVFSLSCLRYYTRTIYKPRNAYYLVFRKIYNYIFVV